MTSGAPFPKANYVAAAMFWLILKYSTIFAIEVLKNISLVEEIKKNNMIKNIMIVIDENRYEPLK